MQTYGCRQHPLKPTTVPWTSSAQSAISSKAVPAARSERPTPPSAGVGRSVDQNSVGVEENVTLSPNSSPSPRLTECSQTSLSVSASRAPVEPAIPAGEVVAAGVDTPETVPSRQVVHYLNAVEALRRLDIGMEARLLLLQKELKAQSIIYDELVAELDRKKTSHQHLDESTRRLTRQVRNLDSENDRLRGRLAELEAETKRLKAAPAWRWRDVDKGGVTKQTNNSIGKQCVGYNTEHSEGTASISDSSPLAHALHPTYSVEHILQAKICGYNRKLRRAEVLHGELLENLHITLAERRGQMTAYSKHASLSFRVEASDKSGGRSERPIYAAATQEAEALCQLEALIGSCLKSTVT
uniref:Uncharacterized protein TCIL3000_11_13570 n=1 Tax=Trypanosoma congolense (strain IL3000) TaxID=1068625 RepID=G0V2H9_TRYCI|nr:unnamed protein product [Trypanosoma congolense IL3000]